MLRERCDRKRGETIKETVRVSVPSFVRARHILFLPPRGGIAGLAVFRDGIGQVYVHRSLTPFVKYGEIVLQALQERRISWQDTTIYLYM